MFIKMYLKQFCALHLKEEEEEEEEEEEAT